MGIIHTLKEFTHGATTNKNPVGRPRRHVDIDKARSLLASGLSLRKTGETMRLGYGTLHRALRQGEAA